MRVDFGEPVIARMAVVRLSTPHVAFTGAHVPGTVRLKELMVGQIIGINSGRYFTSPAMYCFITLHSP